MGKREQHIHTNRARRSSPQDLGTDWLQEMKEKEEARMTPQVPDLGEQMDSGIISQIRAQEEEQVSQERQKQCDYVECELYV